MFFGRIVNNFICTHRHVLPLTHRSRPTKISMVPLHEVESDRHRTGSWLDSQLFNRTVLSFNSSYFSDKAIIDVTMGLLSVQSSHFKGSQSFNRAFISKYKAEVWLHPRTLPPLLAYTSGACLASTNAPLLASHRLFFTSFPEEQHQQRRPKDEHGHVQSQLALRLLAQRHGGADVRLLRHDGVQGPESSCGHPRRPGYAVSRQAAVFRLQSSLGKELPITCCWWAVWSLSCCVSVVVFCLWLPVVFRDSGKKK